MLAPGLVSSPPAQALTRVTYSETVDSVDARGSQTFFASVLIEGDDGPNAVIAAIDATGLVVRDPGGVRAGPGCAEVPEAPGTAARCQTRLSPFVRVLARGGDDRFDLGGLGARSPTTVDAGPGDDSIVAQGLLAGGAGDDDLTGSDEADVLDGGPGRDRLDGRAGQDLADYRLRRAGVRVDLRAGAGARGGEPGEGDRLVAMEGALGGVGDDVLLGGGRRDVFEGGGGDDVLSGGAGDDFLSDRSGGGRLSGGPGGDLLRTQADFATDVPGPVADAPRIRRSLRPGRLIGGDGRDSFFSGTGRDTIDAGGGTDSVEQAGAGDRVLLRDGRPERIACEPRQRPPALVELDRRDLSLGCGEVDRAGPARPVLLSVGGLIAEENEGDEGIVSIACSDDQRPDCRGRIEVRVGGRVVGRRRFAVPSGRTRDVRFRLARSVARRVRRRGTAGARYRVETRDAGGRRLVLSARQAFCDRPSARECDDRTVVDPRA